MGKEQRIRGIHDHELNSSVFAYLDWKREEESKNNRKSNINTELLEEPEADLEPMVLNGITGERYPIDFED